jgi:hypothetical protein
MPVMDLLALKVAVAVAKEQAVCHHLVAVPLALNAVLLGLYAAAEVLVVITVRLGAATAWVLEVDIAMVTAQPLDLYQVAVQV